ARIRGSRSARQRRTAPKVRGFSRAYTSSAIVDVGAGGQLEQGARVEVSGDGVGEAVVLHDRDGAAARVADVEGTARDAGRLHGQRHRCRALEDDDRDPAAV